MRLEGTLDPGQEVSLMLAAGAEFFCASGRVRLASDVTLVMAAGHGWRADRATRVRVIAQERARYRVVPAPEQPKEKPRSAGLAPAQRLLRELTRARRAA